MNINFKKYQKLIYGVCIVLTVIGIILRFVNLRYGTQFTWDQENSLAFPAQEILVHHKLPLIGAKTGVGDLFLTPFYTYAITPFFYLFRMDPIAGAVSAGFFALFTIVTAYYLLKNQIGSNSALMFALIWSVSPQMVISDRIPWNVNLLPLAAILTFSGLWSLIEKVSIKGWITVGIGLFLGTTSHFSVIFLIAYVGTVLLVYRLLHVRGILILLLFLTTAITPLIVFSLRHQNLLLHNLYSFITHASTSPTSILDRIGFTLATILQIIGNTVIPDAGIWVVRTAGILIILVIFLYRKHLVLKRFAPLFAILSVVYLIGYSLYQGNVPEYYYQGLTTVTAIGIGILLAQLVTVHSKTRVLIIVYATFLFLQSLTLVSQVNPHSIGVKMGVVDTIVAHAGTSNQVEVVYDMDLGWSFGFEYLFAYRESTVTRNSSRNAYWISYPVARFPTKPDITLHNFAIGYPTTSDEILSTKDAIFYSNLFSMRIPRNWVILSCPSIDYDSYIMSSDPTVSCKNTQQNMMIHNLPSCSEELFQHANKVKLPNGMQFYDVDINDLPLESYTQQGRAMVAFFEKDRCISFETHALTYSQNFKEILTTLRLRPL